MSPEKKIEQLELRIGILQDLRATSTRSATAKDMYTRRIEFLNDCIFDIVASDKERPADQGATVVNGPGEILVEEAL